MRRLSVSILRKKQMKEKEREGKGRKRNRSFDGVVASDE